MIKLSELTIETCPKQIEAYVHSWEIHKDQGRLRSAKKVARKFIQLIDRKLNGSTNAKR
jgi:hypothetical protein